MARMYPNRLDPNTKSPAERVLYEAFQDQLDNSYAVFHGVNWQSPTPDGRRRDGETDFVIAHPNGGILVLEAKGGGIRCDPRTGEWLSIDRDERPHRIKDPFDQARGIKYTLLYQLKSMMGRPKRRINIGHAVAFPDTVIRKDLPGLDKPREIVLDATDLTDLSGWVGRAFTYYRGKEPAQDAAPGKESIDALLDLLGKAWELRPALWGNFVQERQQLIRLTEQQYNVLGTLSRQSRAAICGCAGSGKTMLAVEKASRLARQGFRTLLTCYNRNLAIDLRARLKRQQNLVIEPFHGLCYSLAKKAGTLPKRRDKGRYYDQLLPEALMAAAEKCGFRYDAIIIDEGQDFRHNWWIPIQMLLRDPDDGIFYVFYDDNQRIYDRHGGFPIQQPPYPLTVNCRNTQAIHRTVLGFYEGDVQPSAQGPEGRSVETVFYGAPERIAPAVRDVLQRLIQKEQVPLDEIAVLTPRSPSSSRLWDPVAVRALKLTDEWPPGPDRVYCTSIYQFKGLEQAVIILAEIEEPWLKTWTDLDQLLYVGCSRARNHLIVMMSDEVDTELDKAFTGAARLTG
jgi:hypothetical protein